MIFPVLPFLISETDFQVSLKPSNVLSLSLIPSISQLYFFSQHKDLKGIFETMTSTR